MKDSAWRYKLFRTPPFILTGRLTLYKRSDHIIILYQPLQTMASTGARLRQTFRYDADSDTVDSSPELDEDGKCFTVALCLHISRHL